MSDNPEPDLDEAVPRELPPRIEIPPIRGEMVYLRPATLEDLPRLDELEAFFNASGITGKDQHSERSEVHTWIRRSVAWSNGEAAGDDHTGDPEYRRTMAWAVIDASDRDDGEHDNIQQDGSVIGIIALIDIDGWARSARIQVILGKDYRGRGYSRDAMPRVMTFGFASAPAGLGMHRIWVAVPEKNMRSLSVYQSLGFVLSGTSRDALWDDQNKKYQDLIVMDTLVDEYDPIRSLDAFGMHVIEDNPGVKEALAAREHSIAIRKRNAGNAQTESGSEVSNGLTAGNTTSNTHSSENGVRRPATDSKVVDDDGDVAAQQDGKRVKDRRAAPHSRDRDDDPDALVEAHSVQQNRAKAEVGEAKAGDDTTGHGGDADEGKKTTTDSNDEGTWWPWPFTSSDHKRSKDAWWRNLGRGRKRDAEGKQ